MRTPLYLGLLSGCALLAIGFGVGVSRANAQDLAGTMAGVKGENALNSGPVGGGGAATLALERARGVAGGNPAAGGPAAAFGGAPAPVPAAAPAIPLTGPIPPRVSVLSGTRVFDAVTGVLLDDPQEHLVPETQKSQYYDDGTHGDVQANDGKFTRFTESHDYLAQSNQRVKEELVQALIAANNMTPLKFYGYSLMSTSRSDAASRNRAWKLVPDPDGIGASLQEVPIDKPLQVPNYRATEAEKDKKVKDDWSDRFLQEFRKNKDSLASEFYPMYIPQPPLPPPVAAPAAWRPFAGGPAGVPGSAGQGGSSAAFVDTGATQ